LAALAIGKQALQTANYRTK